MHSAFGHSPNSNWTPPNSTRHSGAGPGWALLDQFEKIRKIIIVTVNKCPEPSGQAFSPTPHPPKRARPKCRVHQRLWVFPNRPEKVKMSKPPPLSQIQDCNISDCSPSADKYVFDSVPLWRRRYVRQQSNQASAAREALGHICCARKAFFGKLAMPR